MCANAARPPRHPPNRRKHNPRHQGHDGMTEATNLTDARSDAPLETQSARERIVQAASDLFCQFGINATGVDAIIERSGTAKATLYKAFGSKEKLVEAVLTAEGKAWRDWFLAEIDAVPGGPADKLVGCFDILKSWFREERFFGCPFINAVGEFDKQDPRYKQIALSHKKVVMSHIARLASETGTAQPEVLAHQIGLLIDGAIVAAMITNDPQMADYAKATAQTVLRAA